MKVYSALEKAYHQPCIYCHRSITYEDYGYSKTKPRRFSDKSYPSKTIYFHTKCYDKQLLTKEFEVN